MLLDQVRLDKVIIIIIMNLFIEGSLISAYALFFLRALFGATWIHFLIRGWPLSFRRGRVSHTRREVGTFGEETLGTTVPQDENLPTCEPSGLEPPTYHILGRQHRLVHHGLNNLATKDGHQVGCFLYNPLPNILVPLERQRALFTICSCYQ